jgi:hypothetical protein
MRRDSSTLNDRNTSKFGLHSQNTYEEHLNSRNGNCHSLQVILSFRLSQIIKIKTQKIVSLPVVPYGFLVSRLNGRTQTEDVRGNKVPGRIFRRKKEVTGD